MRKLSVLLFVLSIVGFPFVALAFEGIIVQKSSHVASGVNPGMEAMQEMLQQMPAEQRKMMEERMKEAMGPGNSEPDESTQTMYIKGPKMRMDSDQEKSERTFMIMDMQKRVVRNFFPEKKVYMEMSFDEVEEMGRDFSKMRKGVEEEESGKLKKTGKKKKINGYNCQLYTQQIGQYANEYWITRKVTIKEIMGEFVDQMKSFGKVQGLESRQEALMEVDGYPILSVTRNKYGTDRNEVIKIEKKRLSEELFAIPAGYQKQSMADLMAPKR